MKAIDKLGKLVIGAKNKGKLTTEGVHKIAKGVTALYDIKKRRRELKKEFKKAREIDRAIIMDKITLIDTILDLAKKQDFIGMRQIASEYDKKYPGDMEQ